MEIKGKGMSDDDVKNFVDGYYPAYELYTEGLRRGLFVGGGDGDEDASTEQERKQLIQQHVREGGSESGDRTQSHHQSKPGSKGRQMRLVVDRDRKVVDVVVI